MSKLNKDNSFATFVGKNVDGIKFAQGGFAFDNAGNCLGKLVDGKLEKLGQIDLEEAIKETAPEAAPKAKPKAKPKPIAKAKK